MVSLVKHIKRIGFQALLWFEGEYFPAPKDWDKLLRNMYGDYMVLPDEADRQGHFITDNGEKREDHR